MKTTTNTDTRYVITADGIRMSYQEWLEMRKSEMN
jgi:hypothetical protein